MNEVRKFTPEEREALVRRAWYSHDARWFAAVAFEHGIEAANRANRRALRAATAGEMRAVARANGVEKTDDLGEFLTLFEAAAAVFVPGSMMEYTVERTGDRSYDVSFQRCFVHENIVKAGIAGQYECAVFDRVAGWHDAAGLPLAEDPPALPCALAQGQECRRTMTVQ